jgi:hypothetical protein
VISDSLVANLALSSSISLADSAAAAAALDVLDASDARGPWRIVPPGAAPDTEDSRFFASDTAPVTEGLETVRVAVAGADEVVVDDLEVVVEVLEGAVPAVARGFLAAAVVAAVVLLLFGFGEPGAPPVTVEVRRTVPAVPEIGVLFFSSSETEGRERCESVEVAVDGRLMAAVPVPVVPVRGRVEGLFKPPAMLVRVVELVVAGFVEAMPVVVPARRTPVPAGATVRFVAAVPSAIFLSATVFGEAGIFAAVGEVGLFAAAGSGVGAVSSAGAGAGAGADAGASPCWRTSRPSASDMMGYVSNAVGSKCGNWKTKQQRNCWVIIQTVSNPAVERGEIMCNKKKAPFLGLLWQGVQRHEVAESTVRRVDGGQAATHRSPVVCPPFPRQ